MLRHQLDKRISAFFIVVILLLFAGCQFDERGQWEFTGDVLEVHEVSNSEDVTCDSTDLPPLSGDEQAEPDGSSPYCGVVGDEHCFEGKNYECRSDGTSELVDSDCCDVQYRQIHISEINDWIVTQRPDFEACDDPNVPPTASDHWAFNIEFTVKNSGKIRTTPSCQPVVCNGGWSECFRSKSMLKNPRKWAEVGKGPAQPEFAADDPTLNPGEVGVVKTDVFRQDSGSSNACSLSVILYCNAAPPPEQIGRQPYQNDCTLSESNSSLRPSEPLSVSDCKESTPSAAPLRVFTVNEEN